MVKKKKQGAKNQGGRATPKGTPPNASARHLHALPDDEPDLLGDVRAMLREDHPFKFLFNMSQMLEVMTERPLDKLSQDETDHVPPMELLETFIDVDRVETTAILTALAAMTSDEALRQRAESELSQRSHSLPAWLTQLDKVEAVGAVRMFHVLPDGESIFVGLRWPEGTEMTALIYVDHNMGTLVKDAFIIPAGIDEVVEAATGAGDDPDNTVVEAIDGADARERVAEALATTEITIPPISTDTWPSCRSVVEWACNKLPAGGTGYERHEWSDEERSEIADAFIASPHFEALGDDVADHAAAVSAVEDILWFGCDYGAGDPLRLSPTSVEIFLLDWAPRKLLAPKEMLSVVPDVLRAYISFSHERSGVPAHLTVDTQDAITEWTTEFLDEISDADRPQGAEALAQLLAEYNDQRGEDDED